MDREAKEQLIQRTARLRLQVAETLRDALDVTARSREVSERTSSSRRLRWTTRYQQALERKSKEIGDLKP